MVKYQLKASADVLALQNLPFHFHLRVCTWFHVVISGCEHMSKTCCLCVFAAIPLGLIVVPGDSDLETCREHIQRLQEVRSRLEGSHVVIVDCQVGFDRKCRQFPGSIGGF